LQGVEPLPEEVTSQEYDSLPENQGPVTDVTTHGKDTFTEDHAAEGNLKHYSEQKENREQKNRLDI
jgi:hypothetical protein